MNFKEKYQSMLKREYEHRAAVNASYSLRAYARDLGIHSSRLSLILSDKEGLSFQKAKEVSARLPWSSEEREYFCDLVVAGSGRSKKVREEAAERVYKRLNCISRFRTLNDDEFNVISDWFYFTYLQLTRLPDFENDLEWIGDQLSLPHATVENMIGCLTRLEMIDATTLRSTGKPVISSNGVPSHAIRKFNKQILAKASEAIEGQSIEERHLSTLTIALPSKGRASVFNKIIDFRNSMNQYIESIPKDGDLVEVYCLSTQFFRLSKKKENQDDVSN